MSILLRAVQQEIVERFGAPERVTALTGGVISDVVLVETAAERLVVKWKSDAPPGLFEAEADGLRRLRETGAVRVPDVLAWDDLSDLPWLALEYIPARPPADSRRFAVRFGESLAALHQNSPAPDARFGLDRDNYLGSQPQQNTPTPSWPEFYRDRRLRPQTDRARSLGLLPTERERRLETVLERMNSLLDGFSPRAVLIHGDLWSGNFLSVGEEPVLIDPAVCYAEREVEMAYTELFGGFPPGFHAAYDATFPLDSGYARRRPLHLIFPLLIHLNHFGETYGPRLDEALRAALG